MFQGNKEWLMGDWESPGLQITPEVTGGSERRAFASDSSQSFLAQWIIKLLASQRFGISGSRPFAKPQLAFCILAMAAFVSAETCATPECAPPEGWDNFANNLGSDLAPLLALFGEQVTKQYMSESLSWIDSLLFSLAPLGIITAIVGAIRVAGRPKLRSLIGRARESRGEVEADLMSSTSPDVCELWNGEGVVRVLGSPVLLQLIHGEEMEDESPDSDKNAGMYTFREAIRRGFYKKEGAEGDATTDLSETIGTEMRDYSDIEHLQTRENPPNLSLNVSLRPLNPWILIGIVIFGFLLQGGVLAFAAIAQYKLKLKKNNLPVVSYGFPVFFVGTLTLAVGMFLCAHTVETSTDEDTWVPDKGPRSVIWLQQGGQTVGDQRFESFARITEWSKDKLSKNNILTSTQSTSNSKRGRSFLVTLAVSTTFLGFVMQFVGLRVMHSLVTITQLGAVLIMTILRSCAHIQRNATNDINGSDPAEGDRQGQEEHDEVDQVEGHELDWLAKKLEKCQTWEIITGPDANETAESLVPNSRSPVLSADILSPAMRVLRIRARLAQLSSDWKLKDRSTVTVLRNAIETTIKHVFSNMTLNDDLQQESKFSWSVPVNTQFKQEPTESSKIELLLTRDRDEHGNWSDWMTDETMIEAILCLSISSLTEADKKRAKEGLTRLMSVRLLGPATFEARADYRMWTYRGTALTETALEPDNARYFGWISDMHRIPAEPGSTRYVCANAKAELDLLCAQQIYAQFLFQLLSKVKELSGNTVLRSDDAQAANDCGHVRLNNSNLVPIAIGYYESGLGTIEEAYFSIVPALSALGKLPAFNDMELVPHPHIVYDGARKEARRLADDEAWEKATEIESWLCRNSEGSDLTEMFITNEQIGKRILMMTQKLVAETMKRKVNDQLRKLWDTVYLELAVATGTLEARAWSLLNLSTSYEMIKPGTDFQTVFRLAFDTILILDMRKNHSTKVGLKFVQFATDAKFFDEAEQMSRFMLASTTTWNVKQENDTVALIKQLIDIRHRSGQFLVNNELNQYLSHPESLRLAVIQEVKTRFNENNIKDEKMPIDILLISGYRTLLQVAAEYGHKSIVRNILGSNPALSMNAAPANFAGRTALQAAAERGHVQIVELLLVTGANISAEPANRAGRTALQAAAGGGHVEVVKILLAAKADVNAEPSFENGRTALQAAAEGGHVEVANILLAANADVNAKPSKENGRTALQAAAEGGHIEMTNILLAANADVNAKPSKENGRTALQAAAEGGHIEMTNTLLAAKADVNAEPPKENGRSVLQAGAGSGHVEVVKILLAANADVNAEPSKENGRTALQAAAEGGHVEVANILLAANADVNAKPSKENGRTALQAAAEGGHIEMTNTLLAAKADVNAEPPKENGRSVLQAGAGSGHVEVVKILLAANADVNAEPSKENGRTALQAAAEGGHVEVANILLAANADVNAKPSKENGRTALQAAAEGGHIEMTNILLAANADVNAEPSFENGRTALQAAVEGGHAEVVMILQAAMAKAHAKPPRRTTLQEAAAGGDVEKVKIFLAAKADVNAEPSKQNGRTALQAAAEGGHVEVVKILLAAKADVNAKPSFENGRTALQAAAEGGHVKVVEILLAAKADVNAESCWIDGRTALQAAAEGGHVKVVELLLGARVDVNKIPDGLYEAACSGHAIVVQLLLAAKADVNIKSNYHSTPLFRAAMNGDAMVVTLLLAAGADINIPHDGKTVVQAAAQGGFHEVVELLQAASSVSTS